MPWNPEQYHKFQSQRFAPFDDLLALVKPRPGLRAIDLGCGTGELTRRLADALPGSEVVGVDASSEMLRRAVEYERPGLRFVHQRIEDVDGKWDLIFSHAALQWVADHERLIPRLIGLLQPGGQIAVQMPSNHDHFSHRLITAVAAEEPFRDALSGWTRQSPVLPLEEYARLLFDAGCQDMTVYMKVYPHVLPGADAIAEWTSGTALVPYMERLPQALHEPFMDRYRAGLREQYPDSPVLYGFKRILFAATSAAT